MVYNLVRQIQRFRQNRVKAHEVEAAREKVDLLAGSQSTYRRKSDLSSFLDSSSAQKPLPRLAIVILKLAVCNQLIRSLIDTARENHEKKVFEYLAAGAYPDSQQVADIVTIQPYKHDGI